MSPRGVEVIVHQHELGLPGVGDVVGAVEIADRLGVLPQTVSQWVLRSKGRAGTKGKVGRHPFPPARWTVSTFPAWYWPDVAAWARDTGRLAESPPSVAPRPPAEEVGTPVRLVGGPLSGQRRRVDHAGRELVLDIFQGANLLEVGDHEAGRPVRTTYRRNGPADADGTPVYLHYVTEDVELDEVGQ